ncbi:carboxylesterase family protein [Cognatilysobacter tabacisoli]|uniref:carboxylesterase family protein n=1 Tax=Cognatilysobacter tabacisoli TaxID=2315424 RepID=UPI000E6B3E77|nr:prolyl oligopeptidase family serine peptidase [Lysobacter tabacisoli]
MLRPTRLLLSLAALLAVLAACRSVPPASTGAGSGRFIEREVHVAGATHRYQVFVPAAARAGRAPVILFLHGSGERGDDNRRQVEVGLGPRVRDRARDFPAIVVFPQAPDGTEWSDNVAVVLAQLEAATVEFDGDRDRTYLTGLSMGGYGTWDLALREPTRFAALVPVCGGLSGGTRRPSLTVQSVAGEPDPFAAAAQRLRAVPTWIFHGARDDVVPPEQSRRMAAALRAAGAADARYTEFADANHNSWDPAYATDALWPWLFAQRRR